MGDEAGKGGEGAGAPANGQEGKGGSSQQGQPGNAEHMIPKSRFDQVNTERSTFETENKALREQLKNSVDPAKFAELTGQIETTKAEAQAKVELSRMGVSSDKYADYIVREYNGLPEKGRPTFSDFAKQLKVSDPAFFGPAAGSGASNNPTPKSLPNTDKGKDDSPGQMGDPPLTDELIAKMDVATYKRRRAEVNAYARARRP
jgi:hypothetical protein